LSRYGRVDPLSAEHEVDAFDCGSDDQTTWLHRHALQAHRSDTSKVYVICPVGARNVVGYYALTAGSVSHEAAPPRISKGLGRYLAPVIVLTRIGVHRTEQGRGLGVALVRDALLQTASLADRVGVRALLIHAERPEAGAFYQRIDPGFESSPTDPLHLILTLKDLRLAIRDAEPRP